MIKQAEGKAAQLLTILNLFFSNVALIEEAIRKGISDADPEARAAMRRYGFMNYIMIHCFSFSARNHTLPHASEVACSLDHTCSAFYS